MTAQRVFLVRHGETAWSISGQHTGRTDIPLTENGRAVARQLAPILAKLPIARVYSSPLQRAIETCVLAGTSGHLEVVPDLVEWDYGDYEGLTTREIRVKAPDWMLFRDGCPNGESPEDVGRRVDRVIAGIRTSEESVALFAHGHLFRVFAARWIGLPPSAGCHFLLDTATVSVLSYYQGIAAIRRWNAPARPEALLPEDPAASRPFTVSGEQR